MYFKILVVGIVALFALAASGCVLNKPMPAASPTPMPTITPVPPKLWPPSPIGTIASSQVSVKDVQITYTRGVKTMQSENFSILLENSGRTWANNTFLTLRVTDAQTDQFYYASPQVDVGNMSPYSSKLINISTGAHDYGFTVLVEMKWYWGDDLEFKNTFKKAYTLAPVDTKYL